MRKSFLLIVSFFILLSSYPSFAGGGRLCDTSIEQCPEIYISVDTTQIFETETVLVNWESKNGVACNINGNLETSGIVNQKMWSSGNVYFTCNNAQGGNIKSKNEIYITVIPVEITGTLNVSETSILEGESVDISWDIQNAQSCWMNGESVPTQKSYTEYPVAGKYYYLYCTRGNKRTTLTHWLKVQVKQVSVSLSADTTSIQSGESVKLSWDSTNATSCNLDSQTLATSGELEVNPITSRWYTLYCKSPSNTRVASQYIRIQAPQITANLSVSSSTITQGESTKITWSSINASNCTLNGESVALSGNNLVSPNLTQSYILVCDSAVRSLIITVQPPQITANLSASSSTINKGESTTLTWNTQNTQNCTLNGENVSNTGNKLVKPELTQHYILKCNSVLKSVFITVQQPQITANLSASSTAINKGESTTLTWNTQNTQNCTLNGENVSNTGNKLVKPESTQHYTLTCDSVLKSVFIRIQKTSTLPVYVLPSIEIKKSATFLKPGQSAQVTWNASSGATSCVLSWDASNTSTSGKVNIIPSKKGFNSYTIVCKYSNWPHPYKRGFTLYQK